MLEPQTEAGQESQAKSGAKRKIFKFACGAVIGAVLGAGIAIAKQSGSESEINPVIVCWWAIAVGIASGFIGTIGRGCHS